MGLSGRADRTKSDLSVDDLAAEAASIEASVKLAEKLALDSEYEAEASPAGDDFFEEAESIEASVKLAEAIALEARGEAANWSVKKTPVARAVRPVEKAQPASVEGNDLAAEAASIEASVKLAEAMAREAGIDAGSWPVKKAHAPKEAVLAEKVPSASAERNDLAAEAASIEASVRLAERMAREAGVDMEGLPVKKGPARAPTEAHAAPVVKAAAAPTSADLAAEAASIEASVRLAERMARETDLDGIPVVKRTPSVAPARSDLAAEAASIEHSVKLAEKLVGDTAIEGWPSKKAFLAAQRMDKAQPEDHRPLPAVKGVWVWPRLLGRTGKELRREAKYQMYFVYEHFPDELRSLAIQVIAKGCPDLDEKGAKAFVTKVWAHKRLQENLQGALNATYYRELFETEEARPRKRSIPEIYLEGENPRLIFDKMKTLLFKKRELPNRIHLVKTRKGHSSPLSTQLLELFEAEKARAAKRQKSDPSSA